MVSGVAVGLNKIDAALSERVGLGTAGDFGS
jgi:hypothetical protein